MIPPRRDFFMSLEKKDTMKEANQRTNREMKAIGLNSAIAAHKESGAEYDDKMQELINILANDKDALNTFVTLNNDSPEVVLLDNAQDNEIE